MAVNGEIFSLREEKVLERVTMRSHCEYIYSTKRPLKMVKASWKKCGLLSTSKEKPCEVSSPLKGCGKEHEVSIGRDIHPPVFTVEL